MTFSEFVIVAQLPGPEDWRRGQCLFNRLHLNREDLANHLRCTDADPFYRDDRIGHFWAFVEAHWNDKEDE